MIQLTIKWSPLRVNEAMDMAKEFADQIIDPLEQAKLVVAEAKKISNLPQYVTERLIALEGEIDRACGGTGSWSGGHREGAIHRAIERVRDALPKEQLDREKKIPSLI